MIVLSKMGYVLNSNASPACCEMHVRLGENGHVVLISRGTRGASRSETSPPRSGGQSENRRRWERMALVSPFRGSGGGWPGRPR